MSSRKKSTSVSSSEKGLSAEQQQSKVNEVREHLGPLATAMPHFVTDLTVRRFLVLKSWNSQKAIKAMKETIKWRLDYKPEAIRWEDIAEEAAAGKMYRADYQDKQGRTVLVVRPGSQRSKSASEQIRCFVYHLEQAMMNMQMKVDDGQERMRVVWLNDFHGWTLSSTPVRQSRACIHILQNYYPDMIGLAVIHNPPKLFQAFWKLLKPFIDDTMFQSLKFVYSGDAESQKVIADNFDVDAIEEAYGGKNSRARFDVDAYSKRMREEDRNLEEARQKKAAAAAAAAAHGSTPPDRQVLESIMKDALPCSILTKAEEDGSDELDLSVLDDLKGSQD